MFVLQPRPVTIRLMAMNCEAEEQDCRQLLAAWRAGDLAARDRLFTLFYPDLRRAAAAMLRREQGLSLSTRDLINETVVRLVALNRIAWADRAHFLALASRMMRRALLDYARAKRRQKRDHIKVTMVIDLPDDVDVEIEALNAALDALALIDRERADIVEMRYFGGMEIGEIAQVLDLSESTVKRRWATARLWLAAALSEQSR